MRSTAYLPAWVAIFLLGAVSTGCSTPESGNPSITGGNLAGQKSGDQGGHQHANEAPDGHNHGDDHDENSAMAKMEKGLAGLSDEDRTSAKRQHICPVSGDMLGSMGEPLKVHVGDQEVWICCDGCEEDLLADPDKYLAKLKK